MRARFYGRTYGCWAYKHSGIREKRGLVLAEQAEGGLDLVLEGLVSCGQCALPIRWVLELLGRDLEHEGAHSAFDLRERDLVVCRRRLDRLLCLGEELDDVAHHPRTLVERAVLVVRRVGVLGEEVLANNLGDFQRDLVRFRQRVLAHKLHDFVEVLLLLQDLPELGAQVNEVRVVRVVVCLQCLGVLGVADEPVDGREVLALSELLVEPPEHLDNAEGGGSDGVGEITTGGGDSADDGDGAVALGIADAADLAGTLVEGGETCTQVRRVARVGGHFRETAGNLTEGLGPSGRGVSHHGHVVAHVAEVLRDRNPGVDGGFAGSDGHVGRVGHHSRALHDALLTSVHRHRQLGEVLEDFSHLVTALAAADVDNDIRVGKLGQRLRDHSLAATERARDRARSTQHRREKGIENALASEKRHVGHELLEDRARRTHGPQLEHGILGRLALELDFQNRVLEAVVSGRSDVLHTSHGIRRDQHLVGDDDTFEYLAINVTTRNKVVNLHIQRRKLPVFFPVEGRHVDSAGDVHIFALICNSLQRSLDAVENCAQ
mmetsp:Transcript_8655/g.14936  ORF Transcript_8655/g.14936 Transcript_8655/m.14936 type:complete len:548 (+) Transcript_8655:633-2276(+)